MSVYANYGIYNISIEIYQIRTYTLGKSGMSLIAKPEQELWLSQLFSKLEKKKCKITCTCNVCQQFFCCSYMMFLKLKNICENWLSTPYQIQEMQIFTFANIVPSMNQQNSKNVHFCNKKENFDPANAPPPQKKMKPNLSV